MHRYTKRDSQIETWDLMTTMQKRIKLNQLINFTRFSHKSQLHYVGFVVKYHHIGLFPCEILISCIC